MDKHSNGRSESPMFWATIAGALIVLGGVLIALGAALKDIGVGIVVLGVIVLVYAVYRYLGRAVEGSAPSNPTTTVVRTRGGAGTRANRNIGVGTDSVVDATDEKNLQAEGNVRLDRPTRDDGGRN